MKDPSARIQNGRVGRGRADTAVLSRYGRHRARAGTTRCRCQTIPCQDAWASRRRKHATISRSRADSLQNRPGRPLLRSSRWKAPQLSRRSAIAQPGARGEADCACWLYFLLVEWGVRPNPANCRIHTASPLKNPIVDSGTTLLHDCQAHSTPQQAGFWDSRKSSHQERGVGGL